MASSRKSPKNSTLPARVLAVVGRHLKRGDRLIVGLSGGIDSVVLLDLLQRASRRGRFELAAVHVNHQINPAAAAWARFCRALCKRYGIALTVRKVEVARGDSLEAAAREARYGVFGRLRGAAVALAHNLDDQAETVLLQLLRGAGVDGVSAMPEFRAGVVATDGRRTARVKLSLPPAILRPLLEVPRSEIAAYARRRGLDWIEDESNDDPAFDRNYIRHRVMPVISERYPAYRQTLLRASRNFAEAAQLAEALAVADAGTCEATLDLRRLRGLPQPRVKNVLRHFLRRHGLRMPNARNLEECVRQLLQSGAAAQPAIVLAGGELRRHGDALHLVRASAAPAAALEKRWRGEQRWRVPELGGELLMRRRRGEGISVAKLAQGELTLRLRGGGERLQPDPARPRRTLKNLLRELAMPEWRRQRLPLLYLGDSLVYVVGVGVDAAFQADAGEWGVLPAWRPAA
jgi:tRNA(Ile)-lysidine synthase